MKIKPQNLFCLLALILASHSSQAGDTPWYVGASMGRSAISFDPQDFGSGSPSNASERTTVGSNTGYKLFLGYLLNENWSIEGGYARQGQFQFRSTNIDRLDSVFDNRLHSWFLSGKLSARIVDKVSVFGKLGLTQNTTQLNYWRDLSHIEPLPLAPGTLVSMPALTASIRPGNYSKAVIAPLIGIGMEYALDKAIKLRLEYENYGAFGGQATTGRSTNTMTSLGFVYSF